MFEKAERKEKFKKLAISFGKTTSAIWQYLYSLSSANPKVFTLKIIIYYLPNSKQLQRRIISFILFFKFLLQCYLISGIHSTFFVFVLHYNGNLNLWLICIWTTWNYFLNFRAGLIVFNSMIFGLLFAHLFARQDLRNSMKFGFSELELCFLRINGSSSCVDHSLRSILIFRDPFRKIQTRKSKSVLQLHRKL